MVTAHEVTAARSRQRKYYRRAAKFSSDALKLEEEARAADAVAADYAGRGAVTAVGLKQWEADSKRNTAQKYRDLAAWHLALAREEGDHARTYEALANVAA